MKKIKIAQIGVGHDHACDTFRTICSMSDCFDVVGWCAAEGEEERAEQFKKQWPFLAEKPQMTLEELLALPGLEAVTVETDDWLLTKYTHIAAHHGLHIHMDKPGGTASNDPAEFEAMLRTVKHGGKVFQTGYMYRYNPYYLKVLEMVEQGELGPIYSVETHMDCEHAPEKRDWLSHFRGGMMNFLGCHLVDLIFRLQGIPEEILPLNTSSGFDGVTANDIGFAVFRYPHGVSFAKTAACEPGGFMRRQLVVCGQKKTVSLLPFEAYAENGQTTSMRICDNGKGWGYAGEHSTSEVVDRYQGMMRDFHDMACGMHENPYTLDYEARLHRILLAACGETIDYKGDIVL